MTVFVLYMNMDTMMLGFLVQVKHCENTMAIDDGPQGLMVPFSMWSLVLHIILWKNDLSLAVIL